MPAPARPPRGSLAAALSAGTVVLDGGLSNQLAAAGTDLSGGLWTGRALREHPDTVLRAHLDYYLVGASVATTASYQVTFEAFARHGVDRAGVAGLLRRSVALAREAAERAGAAGVSRPMWVAASVGPYGAMLADGSEYRGRYGLSVRELEHFHRPRLEVLAEAGPDVLALETVPDTREAEALLRAADGLGVPAWLSYTVAGGATRAGQPLEEAFALAAGSDSVIAVGANCCSPADVEEALRVAARVTGKPLVGYPNSGETWDGASGAWRGPSEFDVRYAAAWTAAGARLVGGCCRVGPAEITRLAAAVAGR
ncbi:homocysteine S-methyltransferase [Marinitenerispora sediminis]|uniref:homocysteine S-methyltransferase n=1 Tax=Marinitenerispora sediminis TaxID=1931232 RepID=UPI0015F1962C|nr:homocysteine S-methyltransferase [Marinitenerispora sediminis]